MTDDDIVIEEEDGEGSTRTPEEKLKELREKIKKTTKEREEYLEGWQRAKADYVNLRRRSDDDRAEYARSAALRLVLELLPVIDSLDEALEHAEADSPLKKGLMLTRTKLGDVLKAEGVEEIDPRGLPFDPARHESVESVAVESSEMDNKVVKVHQKGYSLNGRIVRPARVGVGHFRAATSEQR